MKQPSMHELLQRVAENAVGCSDPLSSPTTHNQVFKSICIHKRSSMRYANNASVDALSNDLNGGNGNMSTKVKSSLNKVFRGFRKCIPPSPDRLGVETETTVTGSSSLPPQDSTTAAGVVHRSVAINEHETVAAILSCKHQSKWFVTRASVVRCFFAGA